MKKILLISGRQGSGKTTNTAEILGVLSGLGYDARLFKFADPLYAMHRAVLPVLQQYGLRPKDMKKDGELLQVLGTEYGRKHLGEDVWVRAARNLIDTFINHGDNDFDFPIMMSHKNLAIIDDCRFENEFDAFPDAYRVRLECPREVRKARCSYWREVEHASETGLDDYAKGSLFDLTISTETARVDTTALAIRRAWFNDETDHTRFRKDKLQEAPPV